MLFLKTYRSLYYITGLTLYDEELRLEGSEQCRYRNISTTIDKVLNNKAVFAHVKGHGDLFGSYVVYVHDGSHKYYGGLRCKTYYTVPCIRTRCSRCRKKYCNVFKWIGEYINPYKGVFNPIPVIKIEKKNCFEIKKQLEEKAKSDRYSYMIPCSGYGIDDMNLEYGSDNPEI
ncbi:MAG: hypothetical protein IJ677_04460 [Alphaproteobacteria bacterium]|nr:hypothetical protein [Alphaproteobacteria bacterium]